MKKTSLVLVGFSIFISVKAQIASNYEVATWKGFKSAAVTYTLDDNCSKQLSVALPLFDAQGFKVTFNAVTDWAPNWTGLKTAAANGHEVASHTISHPNLSTLTPTQQDAELKNSQSIINTNIPGNQCLTVAYPNCVMGDAATIQKYYIAGRICDGAIIPASPSNFYGLSSIATGSAGAVTTSANLNSKVDAAKSSKGWCVFLTHGIDDDGGYSPTSSTELNTHLKYVKANEADFWVGTFSNVVKYIKERNAMSHTETTITSDSLKLTPTDNLDNIIYDASVTIRRKLPTGWTNARVYLGNTLISSSIVTVNSVKYLMFDVIPDKGVYYVSNVTSGSSAGTSSCSEAGEGAFHTGIYRNMFKELLNKTDAEINTKVTNAFQQIFYGTSIQKLYYEVSTDMAYILDANNNDVRTEGMSYGMMICVQLDKKAEFDKIWKWAKTKMQHTSGNYDGFFAWQCKPDGTIIGNDAAPDGEAYFITALLFAENRWGNGTGIFNYGAEAQNILTKVMSKTGAGGVNNMFNSTSKLITFGPSGDSYTYTDASYNLPGFFECWKRWSTSNTTFWSAVPDASRKLLRDASHATSGLSADYANFDGTPKTTSFNTDSYRFMYDAWRTIMNIGADYHWFKADAQQPLIAERYLTFFKNQGTSYKNHYNWDGTNVSGEHSVGLVSCNAVASLAVTNTSLSTPFVQEFWNVGIPTGTYRYYDGMLYMLALLHCSGNFKIWKPTCVDACSTPAPAVTSAVTYELGAQASALTATGTDLKWYTTSTGGTASLNAPVPSTSAAGITKYYVSQTLNGCEGSRAEIKVSVTNNYKIRKTTMTPIIDGAEDNLWLNTSITSLSAGKTIVGAVNGASDLSGTVKIIWDNTNIYFFAGITDDIKKNDSPSSYDDDAIEIYFDINNDKATTYAANDVQYSFGWNDGSIVGALPSGRSVSGIQYAVVTTANGYTIEGKIPWATLQGSPADGQLVGIDFMINDDDNGSTRDKKLSWNATIDNAWQDPSLFGTGVLMAEEVVTSTAILDFNAVAIYPNPAKDVLIVKGLPGEFDYIISDYLGRNVQSGSSVNRIQLQSIQQGIYFLELRYNNKKLVKKIIIE